MTVVVLGIDALDPKLVDRHEHSDLVLDRYKSIETIVSSAGEPSTHELWPTIITGLPPSEHGVVLDDGVAWENPLIAALSSVADYAIPDSIQTQVGNWLLTNTRADAFRIPATYFTDNGIETVFDGYKSIAIGVPNYVVDPDTEDREHQLRRHMGRLFKRDSDAEGGHASTDPSAFYEQCLEMAMVRIARVRRSLRSGEYELVFGYTSGLDLVGHVAHDRPALQQRAYNELNEFVGELRNDLNEDDELLLVSDHGLQNGLHTTEAMIAASDINVIKDVESVLDIREIIERLLKTGNHKVIYSRSQEPTEDESVRKQLNELGYL
jgi:predicted AlkP superfamily phosphohydrolase/phosphomutase